MYRATCEVEAVGKDMFDTSMSVDGFMTAEFVELYNRYRPHRALGLKPPLAGLTLVGKARRARAGRYGLLDGLLYEYRRAA